MRLFASIALAALVSTAHVAHAAPAPAPSVKVGDPALLFSLPAVNEDAALRAVARPHVALSDFTGVLAAFPARVVVVQFVQRQGSEGQLQALNRLHKRYSNRGVRFLAVVVDNSELAALSEWVESQRLDFPVLRDAHGVVAGRYGVQRYPLTVVVNGTPAPVSPEAYRQLGQRGDADSGDIVALGMPGDDLETRLDAVIAPYVAE